MSTTPHRSTTPTDRRRGRRRMSDLSGLGDRMSRVRISGAGALAVASGLVLAACSGGEDPTAMPTAASSSTTSSSSSPTSTPAPSVDPAPTTATTAAVSATDAPAAPTATQLPALVVDTGGPCHTIGEVAQALDGSPLFCLNDPGGAGPLWLPQPEAGPDATGPALLDQPCAQEGLSVTAPDGSALTCRLTGDGTTPGGLFWAH